MFQGLDQLRAELRAIRTVRQTGRAVKIDRGTILVEGLSRAATLGDMVEICPADGCRLRGEVLTLDGQTATVLPDSPVDGLQVGDPILLVGENTIAPDKSWLGRVIDPYGKSLDGTPLLRGAEPRRLKGAPINPAQRRGLGARLETGLAVFNTMLPIVHGQRIGLFAGSGVGKSTLMGRLAIGLQADIVVIAMIGERGREVREFVERILGPEGMRRCVVVAATSDRSPLLRRRCAWTAMAVAEYFRDLGHSVMFFADSVTRFAEAHREVALMMGEAGSLRGYPPSTASAITELCERAGPGPQGAGDITAIFNVLVAGSDMEEPIADIIRGVLDGHIVLDRLIAERGRFPAIDLLRSVSRSLPHAASEVENALIATARRRLGVYERNQMMIQAGLYTAGSDAEIDAAIACWPLLDAYITESEARDTAHSFERLADCLRPGDP